MQGSWLLERDEGVGVLDELDAMLLLDGEVARPLGGGVIGVDREERHGEVRELAVGVGEVSEGVGVCVGGVERIDQDPWLGGAEGAVLCSAGELGRCRVWNGSVVTRSWMSVSAGQCPVTAPRISTGHRWLAVVGGAAVHGEGALGGSVW